jgi:hypothetical protein
MKRSTLVSAFALAMFLGFGPSPARAQQFGRPPVNPLVSPPLSPYLNLLRGGNPAINYYGLVRPQQDFNAFLQAQQGLYAQPVVAAPTPNLQDLITGHPAQFMNFSHYYNGRVANSAALRPAIVPPAFVSPGVAAPAIVPGGTFTGGTGFVR